MEELNTIDNLRLKSEKWILISKCNLFKWAQRAAFLDAMIEARSRNVPHSQCSLLPQRPWEGALYNG